MDEFEPSEDSKVDDDSKMAGDSTFNDSAINESMQDSFNDSKEVCDEQESKSQPKDNDKEDDPQMKEDEVKKKEVKDDNEDLEGKPDEMDKEFSMEAEEEEEEVTCHLLHCPKWGSLRMLKDDDDDRPRS